MEFTLNSGVFNSLLKRLTSLSGGDDSSTIIFKLRSGSLSVFYRSKVDKVDTLVHFSEKVALESFGGDGTAELYSSNIFSIKVPEFNDENRFPHCKSIDFSFDKATLTVKYGIYWYRSKPPSTTKLKFPLIAQASTSLGEFEQQFSEVRPVNFELNASVFSEAVSLCNFIKSDATSREANGCLLLVKDNNFSLINTDSNSAVKFDFLCDQIGKPSNLVLSSTVLNAINQFTLGATLLKVSTLSSCIYISTDDGREVLAPIIKASYIIEDPDEFFQITGAHLGEVEIKPIISSVTTLATKSKDPYKRTVITASQGEGLQVVCGEDSSDTLPSNIILDSKFAVNGSLFITSSQRLLSVDITADLYFDEESFRITLVSPDKRLMFLIQGLSELE